LRDAYLTDVINGIVEEHPNNRLKEVLPWSYNVSQDLEAAS
jgi:hypothetical protein